jgi:solute carrier family 5 (high affinity choline transporter), member 7
MTGRLSPEQDYFRCVINIPEDSMRVDEPSEIDGEQVR